LQAAIASGRLFAISLSAPRVASERMNTRLPAIAFIADTVASSARGLPARRIDGDGGDVEPVILVEPEAAHQFVGERGFSRASVPSPQYRHETGRLSFSMRSRSSWRSRRFRRRDQAGKPPAVALLHAVQPPGRMLRQSGRSCEHVVDEPAAHLLAVLGVLNALTP